MSSVTVACNQTKSTMVRGIPLTAASSVSAFKYAGGPVKLLGLCRLCLDWVAALTNKRHFSVMFTNPAATNATSSMYCTLDSHVRVWAGSVEAKPDTCDCGMVRFVRHQCECGDVHEKQVAVTPAVGYNTFNSLSDLSVSPLMLESWKA
jgi:hypothetical protein